jgi:hypothetical protein
MAVLFLLTVPLAAAGAALALPARMVPPAAMERMGMASKMELRAPVGIRAMWILEMAGMVLVLEQGLATAAHRAAAAVETIH